MKKRVYELAREYGMKGADLVQKLKDLGYGKFKTHMAVLDDADLLQVEALLEVNGFRREGEAAAAVESLPITSSGFVLKKKTLPPPGKPEAAAPRVTTPAFETPAAPAAHAARYAEEAQVQEESEELEAYEAERPNETNAEEAPYRSGRLSAAHDVRSNDEPAMESETELYEASADELVAEPLTIEVEPLSELESAAELEAPSAQSEGEAEERGGDAPSIATPRGPAPRVGPDPRGQFLAPRPSTPKRQAKILGRIDLNAAPKPSAPQPGSPNYLSEPRPTMGRDRKSMFVRGAGGVRDAMSSQQLRERERSRVQKRSRPMTGKPIRRGPGGRAGSGDSSRPDKAFCEVPINIKNLSNAIGVKQSDLIMMLLRQFGKMATPNTTLDEETAILVAGEFGVDLEVKREIEAEEALLSELRATSDEDGEMVKRPPVIAFLGHVDHGKTSLLDAIRRSNVTAGEAGGITQHIGAYQVTTPNGHLLTILDTPGHEAFTAMRARGANTTDIVVLVVAADDGVMPQTEEAIQHARAAKVPIVVAMNKIDRPEANPQRVLQQLASLGLQPEEWGGEVQVVPTSATKGQGIAELLEAVDLKCNFDLELVASPDAMATGTVLEAKISEGRGIVAHLLVQNGTLRRGEVILAGEGYGRVRAIYNDRGEELQEALPSTPVEVIGLSALPSASDTFYVVDDLSKARDVAGERAQRGREMQLAERSTPRRTLSDLLAQQSSGKEQQKELRIVLRADVQGSLEALRKSLLELSTEMIRIDLLQAGVGAITESDVNLAAASDAVILGFHVSTDDKARQASEKLGIEIRSYHIIYELLDDVRAAMEDRLSPILREQIVGKAEIRQIFTFSKIGKIAGCMVTSGIIKRSVPLRLYRDGVVIYTGKMSTLRRVKDDVRDVREGFECGVTIENYDDIRVGDVIECYEISQERRKL
ncbi:MAG: translation initiation factor IF-2 [Planctomycetes bacterium]|nr:translation initiation factor IF-2 [Planctomycetota bacterium]